MKEKLKKYLKDIDVLVICDSGYGDGGKAKVTDFFLSSGLIKNFIKTTGGNNSGNTNGKGLVFNSLPVGVFFKNIKSFLGNGALLNPGDFLEEKKDFEKQIGKINNLKISDSCPLILPHHIDIDKKINSSQKKGGVGSTSKGISPAYSDFRMRKTLLSRDLLLSEKDLYKKILEIKDYYNFLGGSVKINAKKLTNDLLKNQKKFRDLICDLNSEMRISLKKKEKTLLMSGQGLDLSINFGRWPFVTASDPSVYGSLQGSSLPFDCSKKVINIFQAPLITKVGGGVLDTEIGGEKSGKYCQDEKVNLEYELKKYKIPFSKKKGLIVYDKKDEKILEMLVSKDDFILSVGLRLRFENYGVTSKRPRRFGWCDLDVLKRALNINGGEICITKIDFIKELPYLKIHTGNGNFKKFSFDTNIDFSKFKKFSDFPKGLKDFITFLEKQSGKKVRLISFGPKTNDILFLD